MISIPNHLVPGLNDVPGWVLLLALLAVSLLLIFAGRTIVKVLAFLVVGLIGAGIGGMLGAQYLMSLGSAGALLGIVLGFVLGGLLGIALVAVGIGLAVGYGAYLLTLDFISSMTVAVIVGIIFFIVGVALYGKILTLVTALAGGLLLFDVLRMSGLGQTVSIVLAAVVTLAGIYVNYRPRSKVKQPTASKVGGQQTGHK